MNTDTNIATERTITVVGFGRRLVAALLDGLFILFFTLLLIIAVGIVGILAGIAVLKHPLYSALLVPTSLVIIIRIAAIVNGIISLIRRLKGEGAWAIILGILFLVISIILLASLMTAVTLTVLISMAGTIGGIVLIVFAFRIRGQTGMPAGS